MKLKIQTLATAALLPAAILAITSCSTEPQGQGATMVAVQQGQPGGVMVQTYKETATVTGIDRETRKVTLVTPDGKKSTFKAGPEVVNFDQIQIGDQVTATVTEQLVVFVRKAGTPPSDGAASVVALAPVGAKPGVMMADTVEVTAKVQSIDLKEHKATLLFPDGTTKTFKVRDDVDLTKQAVGDDVVIRVTQGIAIQVQKS